MSVATILKIKGRNVATAKTDLTVKQIVDQLAQFKVGAMVIVDDSDGVCGIISERDVVRALSQEGEGMLSRPVTDFMTKDVITCNEDDSVAELMERMTAGRFRHLPVVTNGELVGIVSIGDVVKQRISEAEEEADQMRAYIATG